MNVPNQFDNVAELGLIAAEYLILPVELTADCSERVTSVVRIIESLNAFGQQETIVARLITESDRKRWPDAFNDRAD